VADVEVAVRVRQPTRHHRGLLGRVLVAAHATVSGRCGPKTRRFVRACIDRWSQLRYLPPDARTSYRVSGPRSRPP
jgi:hypothetical protein